MAGASLSRADLARRAHAVEVQSLGQESGVQDQIAAAYGGVNFIEMPRYPETIVEPIALKTATRRGTRRAAVAGVPGPGSRFIGRAPRGDRAIRGWRRTHATRSKACGSLRGWAGRRWSQMTWRPTDKRCRPTAISRRRCIPSLVSDVARRVIDVARAHGAAGWKVNGAGGNGGSVTLLCGASPGARADLARQVEAEVPGMRVLPVRLEHGRRAGAGLNRR